MYIVLFTLPHVKKKICQCYAESVSSGHYLSTTPIMRLAYKFLVSKLILISNALVFFVYVKNS